MRLVHHHPQLVSWSGAAIASLVVAGITGCASDDAAKPPEHASMTGQAFRNEWGVGAIYTKIFSPNKLRVLLPSATDCPDSPSVSGVNDKTRAQLESAVKEAIMAWVNAIGGVSNEMPITSDGIVFTHSPGACSEGANNSDIFLFLSAEPGCSNGGPAGAMVRVNDCAFGSRIDRTLRHEIGHIFSMGDTYGPYYTMSHEYSSMQLGDYLSYDDIAGVRSVFCANYPNKCLSRWDDTPSYNGTTAFCNGVNGKTLLGDFNGDSRADLLCLDVTSGALSVSLANDAGRHQTIQWEVLGQPVCNWSQETAFVGDFDGDGLDDLFCHGTDNGRRAIRYGNASGGLDIGWHDPYTVWCPTGAGRILVGDFNGDHHSDVLCQDRNSGTLNIDYADPSTGYLGTTDWGANLGWCAGYTSALVVGDFNGDGHDDLLCNEPASGTAQIAFANASGQFGAPGPVLQNDVWCPTTGDMHSGRINGDPRSDIFCLDRSTGVMKMALGDGTGWFPGLSRTWNFGWCIGASEELLVDDISGDGVDDLVCHNKGTGAVQVWRSFSSGHNDFDLDGRPDIVWKSPSSGAIKTWHMNGMTKMSESPIDENLNLKACCSEWDNLVGVDDFNRDGQSDYLWHNMGTDGRLLAWHMMGNHRIGYAFSTETKKESEGWRVDTSGDFDGDGYADVLWHNGVSGELVIWTMKSENGTLVRTSETVLNANVQDTQGGWRVIGSADFDGDMDEDILWHHGDSGQLAVWFMNGTTWTGTYEVLSQYVPEGLGWRAVSTDDFDGDGKPNILWYKGATGELSLWTNKVGVNFLNHIEIPPGNNLPESAGWTVVRD